MFIDWELQVAIRATYDYLLQQMLKDWNSLQL